MKKIITLFLLTFVCHSFAYVATRTEYDQKLKWDSRTDTFDVYFDPTTKGGYSTSLLAEQDIISITEDVIAIWTDKSPYKLELYETSMLPSIGTSRTIRFSDDASYFGSGVLAVTSVSHSASTGKIYAADILINDSSNNPNLFTSTPMTSGGYYAFYGDVLSHEMGHLMGLGHSEVFGSTMVYSVFKGQMLPHTDDLSGIDSLYDGYFSKNVEYDTGSLSGTIVSGENIPVFGAQVQAISYKTGKVVAGVLSEADGTFEIKFLPQDDSYMIYVLPPRGITNLPTYYASIQTKYCAGNSYVPSFFTKCGGRSRGRPQVLSLEGKSNLDVGNVTVRCDEGVSPEYLYAKNQQENYLVQEAISYQTIDQIGEAFVGYFSDEEISKGLTGNGDKLKIDLSHFEHPGDGTYQLNVKVITEDLGSAIGTYADLFNYNENLVSSVDMDYGQYAQADTMLNINFTLSQVSSSNVFYMHLFPRELSSNEKTELFASSTTMVNKNSTYLVVTSLTKSGEVLGMKDSSQYRDNYYCTEGDAIVTARPNAVSAYSESSEDSNEDSNAPSCGTIDISGNGGGPGQGMMSFLIGLIFSLISFLGIRKSNDFFV